MQRSLNLVVLGLAETVVNCFLLWRHWIRGGNRWPEDYLWTSVCASLPIYLLMSDACDYQKKELKVDGTLWGSERHVTLFGPI